MSDEPYKTLLEERADLRNRVDPKSTSCEALDKDPGPQPGNCYQAAPFSLNNRILLEPYKADGALKTTERNGFAMITQKMTVVGLRVMMEARIKTSEHLGVVVNVGDTAYIREELLHTQPWAKKVLECSVVEGQFIIVDLSLVEFIVPK